MEKRELRLALVKFLQVTSFKSDVSMSLVNFSSEFRLNALHLMKVRSLDRLSGRPLTQNNISNAHVP